MNINRITIIPIFAVFFGCMYGAHATEYVTGLRSYITHNLVEVFSANDTISDFYFVSPSDLIQNLPAGRCIQLTCTSKTPTTAGGAYTEHTAYNVSGCVLTNSSASPNNYSCTRFCNLDEYVTSDKARCNACPDNSYGSASSANNAHTNTSCRYCDSPYYWNGSQCTRCTLGSLAAQYGSIHGNSTCTYCTRGYYWNGSQCASCPKFSDGAGYAPISTPGIAQRPSITQCYVAGGTNDYVDSAGNRYVITQDCYYTN